MKNSVTGTLRFDDGSEALRRALNDHDQFWPTKKSIGGREVIINPDGTYEYNAQEYAHASLREDVRAEVRSQMEELKKDMPNCDGANFILWVCAACLFIAGIMAWHDSIFEKGKKAALEEKKSE